MSSLNKLTLAFGTLVLAFGMALAIVSCGSAQQDVGVATYSSQQLSCTQLATTRAQDDACRAGVWVHYCGDGGSLADAGVCTDHPYLHLDATVGAPE